MNAIGACEHARAADVYSQSAFGKTEILEISKGNGPKGFPLLPKPGMLMLDRVTGIDQKGGKYLKGQIQGAFDISPENWFFHSHFENDPIMPGSLGLDGLCQLLGFYLGYLGYCGKGRAIGVGKTRYKAEITPGFRVLDYHIDIRHIKDSGFPFALADGTITCQGNTITEASGISVGIQLSES